MSAKLLYIPEADYHADRFADEPHCSHSALVTLLQYSPLHALMAHPKLSPQWEPPEFDSAAQKCLDMGKAAHIMLLEPSAQIDRLVWVDADDWRKKDAQDLRAAARAADKVALLSKDRETVRDMALQAGELLYLYAQPMQRAEHSILWTEQGVLCKARPDYLDLDSRIIVDYKTTGGSAKPEAVARRVAAAGYDVQAALYLRAARAISPGEWRFRFLTQETDAPYDVSLTELTPLYLDLGQQKVERGLELWRNCLESGNWPGYPKGIVSIDPPSYELAKWEEAVATGDGLSFNERLLLGTQA